jgi:hypothetical protein
MMEPDYVDSELGEVRCDERGFLIFREACAEAGIHSPESNPARFRREVAVGGNGNEAVRTGGYRGKPGEIDRRYRRIVPRNREIEEGVTRRSAGRTTRRNARHEYECR